MPKNKKDKQEKPTAEPASSNLEQKATSSSGSDTVQPPTEKVAKEDV